MKKNIGKYVLLFAVLLSAQISFAQIAPSTKFLFTADSIKSGNAKDILTSFFQLGLNNLTGPNKEFSFSSNPFAIMLKKNPKLNIDKSYKRYKPLRRLNFNLGVRLDTAFRFNGFSSGLKFSLIDETDATTSKFVIDKLRSDALNHERDILMVALSEYMSANVNSADKPAFVLNINKVLQDAPFSSLDAGFQAIVKQLATNKSLTKIADVFNNTPNASFKQIDMEKYNAIKNSIKNNLLWTIGISDSTYKDKFQFSNVAIVSELSRGIFDPEPGDNNLEVHVKAAYTFSNDSTKTGRNLNRELFTAESGINWVLRDRTTERSFCEIKFSGSYYHNFASLYANERRDSLTINGTLRVRILEDIWIPLEVKYDPKSGNIFGFLNIRANFTGLGKLLKSQ
jgi:hypothetical protein